MTSVPSEPLPNWSNGRIVQPALPAGTTTSTWPIWVMALLPLLGPPLLLLQNPLAQVQSQIAQLRHVEQSPTTLHAFTNPFTPSFFVSQGIGLVLIAAQVLLALADHRILSRRGIVRPFHWAWAFLQPTYVIGRAVVVRRRTGAGLAPLWLWIATEVVALGFTGWTMALLFASMARGLS